MSTLKEVRGSFLASVTRDFPSPTPWANTASSGRST